MVEAKKRGDSPKSQRVAVAKKSLSRAAERTEKSGNGKRAVSPVQAVVTEVREEISLQKILPGARITEEELADGYKIPRAMAREVLAALEDRGLVRRIPNKGAVVSVLDLPAITRYYELREALDGLTVRLATEKTKASDWDDLVKLLGNPFEACIKNGDIDRLVTTIEAFRFRIGQAADSPELSDLSERIHERLRVIRRRVALLPGRAEKSVAHYRALLAAIISGDADMAERRSRELNRSTRADIERYAPYIL